MSNFSFEICQVICLCLEYMFFEFQTKISDEIKKSQIRKYQFEDALVLSYVKTDF